MNPTGYGWFSSCWFLEEPQLVWYCIQKGLILCGLLFGKVTSKTEREGERERKRERGRERVLLKSTVCHSSLPQTHPVTLVLHRPVQMFWPVPVVMLHRVALNPFSFSGLETNFLLQLHWIQTFTVVTHCSNFLLDFLVFHVAKQNICSPSLITFLVYPGRCLSEALIGTCVKMEWIILVKHTPMCKSQLHWECS